MAYVVFGIDLDNNVQKKSNCLSEKLFIIYSEFFFLFQFSTGTDWSGISVQIVQHF